MPLKALPLNKISLYSLLVILCLGSVVYAQSLHGPFVYDDNLYIKGNAVVRDWHNWAAIWTYCPCRFLTFLSFAINYHLGRFDVVGYHVVNLAIHLGSAVLVWWLVMLTFSTPAMSRDTIRTKADSVALLAALIFVTHPVQTEAVSDIWQRAASLAAFFYLISLCCYAQSRLLGEKRAWLAGFWFTASLVFAICAMFTKENTITLPVMIILYEYCFLRETQSLEWRRTLPFLLLVIPATMMLTGSDRFQEIRGVMDGPAGVSPAQYLITEFRVIVTYLRLTILPLNQNLDYDYPLSKGLFEGGTLWGFVLIISLLAVAIRVYPKHKPVSFGIFWFFLTLVPESSLLPLEDVISEHRLYLPLVGYSIFLVTALFYLLGRLKWRVWVMAAVVIVAVNSMLASQRNLLWSNDLALWNDTIRKSPHKPGVYINRGFAYSLHGLDGRAKQDYDKAMSLHPDTAAGDNGRGLFYLAAGQTHEALTSFNRALERDPGYKGAYRSRGKLYMATGDFDHALLDFAKAGDLAPDKVKVAAAIEYSADRQLAKRDFERAIREYSKVIGLDPNYVEAYVNRGIAYVSENKYDQAIADYGIAISLKSKGVAAYNDRGAAYGAKGEYDEAIANFNEVLRREPNLAGAYVNRARAYYLKRDLAQALKDLSKAKSLGAVVDQKLIERLGGLH